MKVSENFIHLIKDLKKINLILWAEDYDYAIKMLDKIKKRYEYILKRSERIKRTIDAIEIEEWDKLKQQWSIEDYYEKRKEFRRIVLKNLINRILSTLSYEVEDILTIPLMKTIANIESLLKKFQEDVFKRNIPKKYDSDRYSFTTRKILNNTYEVKGYWKKESKKGRKPNEKVFVEIYTAYLKEKLKEPKYFRSIMPEIMDMRVEVGEKTLITGGVMLISDAPQIIDLLFASDNERIFIKITLKGIEKYIDILPKEEYVAIIGKAFIESMT